MKRVILAALVLLSISSSGQSDIGRRTLDELRILSWNIYMLPRIVPRTGRIKRAWSIAVQLKTKDYDIIVFQEAFMKSARDVISTVLLESFPYQYGPFNERPGIRTNSGVWILSKIPLKVISQIEYENCATFDCLSRKGAALLSGEFNGNRFQLLGTHLQADKNYDGVRRKQINQIARLMSAHAEHGVPQIVCGDMNTEQCTPMYYDLLERLSIEDGIISGGVQCSYDGKNNEIANFYGTFRQLTVDYILVKTNGALLDIERSINILKMGKKNLSDHYGIASSIIFNPRIL